MKYIAWEFLYLGFALAHFANLTLSDWETYAIMVPTILISSFRNIKF